MFIGWSGETLRAYRSRGLDLAATGSEQRQEIIDSAERHSAAVTRRCDC